MARRKFNWWEGLATVGGGIAGGLGGLLVGQPVAGAALGAGLGQAVSPGGFWSEAPGRPPAALGARPGARGVMAGGVGRTRIGRPALGDELNEAAEAEYGAAATRMRRELATALMGADLQYGAAGTYESGARLQRREEMQQAGMRDLATAFAGIELERAGLAQRGEQFERGMELQEAQLRMQGEAARSQMYGQVAASSVPIVMEYIIPFIMNQFGGGEATGLPQLDIGWEPGPYSPLGR